MIQITANGEALDLPAGFSLDIEESSPIFNDTGSAAISVELPATPRNRRIFGFPARPDAMHSGLTRGVKCRIEAGAYLRSGTINVDSAGDASISINIGFDNSIAYDAWKSRRLSEVESLPCYRIDSMASFQSFLNRLFRDARPKEDDLAIFPICVAHESLEEDGTERDFPEIINDTTESVIAGATVHYLRSGGNISRVIDGVLTQVDTPAGYGCTPFVKVWKILECVFADLGLEMDVNPFREDVELARLVVLNNTADTTCNGTLDYAELMPDCTVDDFLQALFVRFGMVYRTDFDTETAHVRLLRDIAGREPDMDLDGYLSDHPEFEYATPQYVRLSAGTSLEGAEPYAGRLEDFMRECSFENVFVANDPFPTSGGEPPDGFMPSGTRALPEDTPDQPQQKAPAAGSDTISDCCTWISRPQKPAKEGHLFSWDTCTGKWWRTGTVNGVYVKEQSTSFFAWDPQPEGLEPLDLSSPDEWCPLGYIRMGMSRRRMPEFLTGSRHYHTYLESDGDEDGGDCPLSFMFAMTGLGGYDATHGMLSGDIAPGNAPSYRFRDGSKPVLSLYFNFRNGLYATFWRDFDMMLRNADRRANVTATMDKTVLRSVDILSPVMVGGVPMIIDRADVTLGSSRDGKMDMSLIPMMRHPEADEAPFADEVPDFPPVPDVL